MAQQYWSAAELTAAGFTFDRDNKQWRKYNPHLDSWCVVAERPLKDGDFDPFWTPTSSD